MPDKTLRQDCGFKIKIDRSPNAVAEASRDFGRLISGRAEGVIAITTPNDLVTTIRHANSTGLSLTPCGTRASCSGQSLPNGGLSLDMTKMTALGPVDLQNTAIECESVTGLVVSNSTQIAFQIERPGHK